MNLPETSAALERDALDHIMRVAREGLQPTRRLDWIEHRARVALAGEQWTRDHRDHPENTRSDEARRYESRRQELAALRAELQAANERIARLEEALRDYEGAYPFGRLGEAARRTLTPQDDQSPSPIPATE